MNEEIKEMIDNFRVLQTLSRGRQYKIFDDGKIFEVIRNDLNFNAPYFRILYGYSPKLGIQLQLHLHYDGKMTPPKNRKLGYMEMGLGYNEGYLYIYKLKDENHLKEVLEKYITRQ